jgi:hypothetical protein
VQTAHSVAEFAHQFPNHFEDWNRQSKYMISLSVDNEESLIDLYDKLKYYGANVVAFYEPDIDNQMTAICYYGTPEMRRYTQKLDLALDEVKVAIKN